MTGNDLTPAQLAWSQAIVGRHLRVYERVRARMERRRWQADDRLYRQVCQALDAVKVLDAEVQHLGRPEGLGVTERVKLETKAGEQPGWVRAMGDPDLRE
jgi:hypothetical protein